MAMTPADRIVERLLDAGFSREVVEASWPDWWASASPSSSSRTLISLLLARRLSLDPVSLLDDNVPIGFLHTGPTKFKHMRLAPGPRRNVLVAFAQGVGRIALAAVPPPPGHPIPVDPIELRQVILDSGRDFISFGDVLTACWSLGVPVLHLRLFPARTKGITAIAVRLGARHAILVARESGAEAQYMFHVAHELGHIALGHLKDASAIVDADPDDLENDPGELIDDDEEAAADAYAQGLLTGSPAFSVERMGMGHTGSASELARRATETGRALRIDPGHIVMSFGHSTRDWALAMAAVKLLPAQSEKPGTLVNRVLWDQLTLRDSDGVEQSRAFLQAVAPV